ncbi:MAG: ACT domain-containing protein [Candidatus Omnitrophica bacterium]|nr:ACT domain-containing protein [Candidatus Omnitrophota bacterium]
MENAKLVKQLIVTTQDKPGMLAEVTGVIASQGINIEAICAYGMEGKAIFYLVTKNNAKAKQALTAKGWQVNEEDVVMLDLENKPGALSQLSSKLKAKNINLKYCYGSACSSDCPCRLVLNADDNKQLLEALK